MTEGRGLRRVGLLKDPSTLDLLAAKMSHEWLSKLNPVRSERRGSMTTLTLSSSASSQGQHASEFFTRLPSEIRLLIYRYAIGLRSIYLLKKKQWTVRKTHKRLTHFELPDQVATDPERAGMTLREHKRDNLLNLLLTCKQV
jgi:hypothetical protein